MSDAPTLLYLEADDEITTVVRRMRDADPGRVVIVAPGRSRATSSTVALRLLARAAESDGRPLAVVGDALTRSLATEAGIAAFSSVADARKADPAAPVEPSTAESRTAAIHVVRGEIADDTAPTLTAVAAASREADTVITPAVRPRPEVPSPRTRQPPGRRRVRRRIPPAAVAAIVVAVLFAWGAIAAVVLPAAAITITPRSEAVGPVERPITLTDVETRSGTVPATAAVTATGPFDVNEPARGRVTFFNFNAFDVAVPAGALVATGDQEGDQAFETLEAIVVPAATFDPFQGGITAGEASVDVQAAAPGPDGNVPAGAIDTVLDPNLAGQLRGFPSIRNDLVENRIETSGGATESGVEITQEDVDAAVAELTDALHAAVEEELGLTDADVFVDRASVEPVIDLPDDLVGSRDAETVEIEGTLAYDVLVAEREVVELAAIEQLRADSSVVPVGWDLDPESIHLDIGQARASGDGLSVDVTLTGERLPVIERTAVLARIIGLSEDEAEAAIADIGTASVELWPVWVSTVPDREWRIDLVVADP